MRKITKAVFLPLALALTGGATAAPALADIDFRFGIDIGPPVYHYRPYYYSPYYGPPYYYHPHGRYYDYR